MGPICSINADIKISHEHYLVEVTPLSYNIQDNPSVYVQIIESGEIVADDRSRVPAQDVLFALILWYVAKTLY